MNRGVFRIVGTGPTAPAAGAHLRIPAVEKMGARQ